MKLLDVLTAPWAIEPDKLLEIRAIYATHLRGEKIDLAALEARLGRPLANAPQRYEVIDGVAVIPMEGVMAKRANMFMDISGGVSMQLLERDLQDALNDPAVHSIILAIDSPGGTVDGTQTLANAILNARDSKPVVALASGTMASAAYWTGSAAQAIYVTDGTTLVGSIGVVAAHRDVSAAEEKAGVKTTEIYAGQYKRIASSYAPLSDAGKQSIQDQVDYTYSLFVSAVAANRGVSEDKVLKDMADGRVFMGQQAIDAGLVDGVSTLGALVAKLNEDRSTAALPSRSAGAAQSNPNFEGNSMNAAELAAAHPEAAAELRAQGATAERERIQAVENQIIPGHEALISTMKYDGKSSAGDAAIAVNGAEKKIRSTQAANLEKDAPDALKQKPAETHVPEKGAMGKDGQLTAHTDAAALDTAAKEYMAANPSVTYIAAVKAVQKGA